MIRVENVNVKPADMSGYRILINPSKIKRAHYKRWLMDLCPTYKLLDQYISLYNQSTHHYYIKKNSWFHQFEDEYIQELNSNQHSNELINIIKPYISKVDIILLYDDTHNPLMYMSAVALRDYIDIKLHHKAHVDNTLHTMLYNDSLSKDDTSMPLENNWLRHHRLLSERVLLKLKDNDTKYIFYIAPNGLLSIASHSLLLYIFKAMCKSWGIDFVPYNKREPKSLLNFSSRLANQLVNQYKLHQVSSGRYIPKQYLQCLKKMHGSKAKYFYDQGYAQAEYVIGSYHIFLLPKTKSDLLNPSLIYHEKCGLTQYHSGYITYISLEYDNWSNALCPNCIGTDYSDYIFDKCKSKLGSQYDIVDILPPKNSKHHNGVKLVYTPKDYTYWTSIDSVLNGHGTYLGHFSYKSRQQLKSLNHINDLYEYSKAVRQYIKRVRGYIHKRVNNQ